MYPDFKWFMGIVEDRADPEKIGRVKVRCFGLHTEDKIKIPTASLPWATVMQPVTSAAVNNIGRSPTGLVEGTMVIGFFSDGDNMQQPVIMGTTAGFPQVAANAALGFNDPNAVYPRVDDNFALKESDVNRLARNDIEHTSLTERKAAVVTGVPIAFEGTWDEPITEYAAVYPYNHVTESESGHYFEVDDTEGAERVLWSHRTGTFSEVFPDGSRVTKIVAKDYEIILDDKNINIKNGGSLNITVDSGDVNLKVSAGNLNEHIIGDYNLTVTGNETKIIGGDVTETVSGLVDETVGGTHSTNSGGGYSVNAPTINLN